MARSCSLSNIKLIAALADNVSLAINRRGFAAVATQDAAAAVLSTRSGVMKAAEAKKRKDAEVSSWVPDPITGYYRPANQAVQIDVAELRQVVLNNTNKGHN